MHIHQERFYCPCFLQKTKCLRFGKAINCFGETNPALTKEPLKSLITETCLDELIKNVQDLAEKVAFQTKTVTTHPRSQVVQIQLSLSSSQINRLVCVLAVLSMFLVPKAPMNTNLIVPFPSLQEVSRE